MTWDQNEKIKVVKNCFKWRENWFKMVEKGVSRLKTFWGQRNNLRSQTVMRNGAPSVPKVIW